jgi:hypothetical protein
MYSSSVCLDLLEHWVTSEISDVSTEAEEAESVVFASISTDDGLIKKFPWAFLTSKSDE